MSLEQYLEMAGEWVLTSGIRIILILLLAVVAVKLATVLAGRLVHIVRRGNADDPELKKRTDTLSSVTSYAARVVVLVLAAMMILRELGVEIGPLLAAAGVVGLAIGFGAQNLVQDVITGFFILLHDQIRVGDVVEVAGKSGLVESVDLRMVTLRDLSGNVHFVRNGQIQIVTNMTMEYSRYVLDVGVAYREDVDEVIRLLREVDESMRSDPEFGPMILEPLEVFGLDELGDSAVVIKARTTTLPIKQWTVGREFKRRLKKTFDQHGIEIPFPHVTLYMGRDKQGSAPPLYVELPRDPGRERDSSARG